MFIVIVTGIWAFLVEGLNNTDQVIEPEYAEFYGTINKTLGSMQDSGNTYLNSSLYGGKEYPLSYPNQQ